MELPFLSSKKDDGHVLEMLLIHRGTHAIIGSRGSDVPAPAGRKIAAMIAYLQHLVRDEETLVRYAGIETIRVEKLTYAVHVGPLAILISAISGKRAETAALQCRKHLAHLHAAHAAELEAGKSARHLLDHATPMTAS